MQAGAELASFTLRAAMYSSTVKLAIRKEMRLVAGNVLEAGDEFALSVDRIVNIHSVVDEVGADELGFACVGHVVFPSLFVHST